jgi:hypothetical protein
MDRMPTKAAEDIYSVLQRYAEASPKYYDREGFIYSFGVIAKPPRKFRLNCMDGKRRTFVKSGDTYTLEGKGDNKVNTIIKKILAETPVVTPTEIEDFKISEV